MAAKDEINRMRGINGKIYCRFHVRRDARVREGERDKDRKIDVAARRARVCRGRSQRFLSLSLRV